jgi:ribosome-associated translation inhibitor RaiA
MKTTLRYLSLNAQATWHRQVEEQLKHLHSLTAITSADVVLEHQREAKPAFRVQVRLEVPGPGTHAKATRHTRQAALLIHGPALHAEARDNTLEAALLKATRDLEHQVQTRQLRRLERGKSKLQRRFQPVDQRSSRPTAKPSMNPGAMKTDERKYPAADGLFIRPAADAVAPIEPEDLSRFEGEGGSEAPVPTTELIEVPLENAIWRRAVQSAPQPNKATIEPEH